MSFSKVYSERCLIILVDNCDDSTRTGYVESMDYGMVCGTLLVTKFMKSSRCFVGSTFPCNMKPMIQSINCLWDAMICVSSWVGMDGVGLRGEKYVEAEYNAVALVDGIREHNTVSRARKSDWAHRTLNTHVVACLSLMGIHFNSKGMVVFNLDCSSDTIAVLYVSWGWRWANHPIVQLDVDFMVVSMNRFWFWRAPWR